MWRYSSMMALDFLSSSSSLRAGLAGAGGGGAGADIGFTRKPKQVKRPSIYESSTQTFVLLAQLRTVLHRLVDSHLCLYFYRALDCLGHGSPSCWRRGEPNQVDRGCRLCALHFHGWSCVWWWADGVCLGLGPDLPAYYQIGQSDLGHCVLGHGHCDLGRYGPY